MERDERHARRTLASRGVQVVGVYVGLVDTDMAAFAPASAKSRPKDVIRQVLDGIESGANEVLADEMTRHIRAELGNPSDSRSAKMHPPTTREETACLPYWSPARAVESA